MRPSAWDRLVEAAANVASGWLSRRGPAARWRLGALLGVAWYLFLPIRRGVVRANLRRVLKDEGPLARELRVFRVGLGLGRGGVESAAALAGRPAPIRWEGLEHLRAARIAGRGAVIAAAHLGPWEALLTDGARQSLAPGAPEVPPRVLHAVVRRPSSPGLRRWLDGRREAAGVHGIWEGEGIRPILRALRGGAVVVIPVDQRARRGARVPFLGAPARLPPLAAVLAARAGAPLLLATGRHTGPGAIAARLQLIAEARNVCTTNTSMTHRVLLAAVGDAIRASPDQWLWAHRLWRDEPTSTPPSIGG